ncbi:hypothetical protein M514_22411, partial [Trichuris suis]
MLRINSCGNRQNYWPRKCQIKDETDSLSSTVYSNGTDTANMSSEECYRCKTNGDLAYSNCAVDAAASTGRTFSNPFFLQQNNLFERDRCCWCRH